MLRWVLFGPVLLLLVLFALSNPQNVQLGLWPLEGSISLPLSIAILLAMAVAFLLGTLMHWLAHFSTARRARKAEQSAAKLHAELAALKAAQARGNHSGSAPAQVILPPPS